MDASSTPWDHPATLPVRMTRGVDRLDEARLHGDAVDACHATDALLYRWVMLDESGHVDEQCVPDGVLGS